MSILRAFVALLTGFLTMALPIGVFTAVIMKRAPGWVGREGHPNTGYVVFNLALSLATAIAGGYVTVWIGHDNPLRYALVLALAVLLLGGISAVQQRGRQPLWYQLLLVVLMPVGVLLGGWLRVKVMSL